MTLTLVRAKADIVGHHAYDPWTAPRPEWVYRAVFTEPEAAERYAHRVDFWDRVEGYRTMPSPFDVERWEQVSSLPPDILRDWLRDEDIEPPDGDDLDFPSEAGELWLWGQWWERLTQGEDFSSRLTRAQRERIWLGLDRYATREFTAERAIAADEELTAALASGMLPATVFAVVVVLLDETDRWYSGHTHGRTVHLTRTAAEAAVETEKAHPVRGRDVQFHVLELPLNPDHPPEG